MYFKWYNGFLSITRKTFLANWSWIPKQWSFYVGIDKNWWSCYVWIDKNWPANPPAPACQALAKIDIVGIAIRLRSVLCMGLKSKLSSFCMATREYYQNAIYMSHVYTFFHLRTHLHKTSNTLFVWCISSNEDQAWTCAVQSKKSEELWHQKDTDSLRLQKNLTIRSLCVLFGI